MQKYISVWKQRNFLSLRSGVGLLPQALESQVFLCLTLPYVKLVFYFCLGTAPLHLVKGHRARVYRKLISSHPHGLKRKLEYSAGNAERTCSVWMF